MSSTSNAQDLLVNVFRPTYTYDSNTGFTPALVVSNVSELIAGRINTDRLGVADSNGNSYVGCNAGSTLADGTTYSNVAIGVSAMAGASNSSNNVSVGLSNFSGLSNANSNVGLGANTLMTGAGQKNVLIGANVTLGTGSGNIVIGNDLALGNISNTLRLGNILYGNLTTGYIGINNPAPAAALDISGEVLFRNKVGVQKTNPIYTLDVAGSIYATEQIIGGKGTLSNPMYTFIDSSGSGMYVPVDPSYGTGSFGIAVNRAPAAIFSSNAVNFFQNLDVSGTFSARNVDISAFSVTDGTALVPSVTFTNDTCTGLFLVSSNRLGVATGGFRRMEVLSNGDVSMGKLAVRDISLTGTIVGSNPDTVNIIGGVTLSNGNVILTGTATNTNLLVPGWIRDNATTFVLDISGGNISNALTTRSSNFRASAGTAGIPAYSFASDPSTGVHSAGTSQLAFDTSGVQRMVISNGNVGIGKAAPVVALEVVGDVSATTYNGPGGTQAAPHYTSSDDRTTGLFFPGANMLGVTAGGTERMRISNGNVGIGTTTPANALDVAGTIRVIGAAGDLTLSNGTIKLGSATLLSSTGVLSNATNTSNSIGGVTLNNTDITYAGKITGSTDNTSNRIGGVTLNNFDVSLSGEGKIVGMSSAANVIGGVSLTNNQISNSSTTTSSTFRATGGGAAVFPAYSFSNATQTGMLHSGGFLQFAISAETRFQISANTTTVSNQLAVTDGTAAAPGYAFTSDAGLGLFRAGANQLALATSGSNRMTVLANGNVGIGTSSPGFELDVAGVTNVQTAGAGGTLYVGGNTGLFMFCDAATTKHGYIRALGSTANLYLGTSNTNHMMITNGGLVGIGTTAPQYRLDISSTGTLRGGELRLTSNGIGYGALKIQGSTANHTMLFQDVCATTPVIEGGNYNGWLLGSSATGYAENRTHFYIYRTNGGAAATTPAMTIQSNGNVGIGTARPGNPLTVVPFSTIGWANRASTNPINYQVVIADGGGTAPGLYLGAYYTGGSGAASTLQSSDSWNGTINPAPLLLNPVGGAVGIGTATPESKLHMSEPSSATGAANVLMMSTGSIKNGAYNEIQFRGKDANGTVYLSAISGVDTGSGSSGYQGELRFLTTESANQTFERMRIQHDGNIGINKTNPGYRLDVNGTTRATAFIGNGTIPVGGIIMWSGTIASIPTGWSLCDGANGTPDLRDRFVLGAGNTYGAGTTGGASNVTLNVSNVPPHRHRFPTFYTNGDDGTAINYYGGGDGGPVVAGTIYNAADQVVTLEGNNPQAFSILPPYYALAFIMRTA